MNSSTCDELGAIHKSCLLDPASWMKKARELLAASEILRPAADVSESGTDNPYIADVRYMLIAFAIENLIKAHIVKTQPQMVSDEIDRYASDRSRRPRIFTHDLLELLRISELKGFKDDDWAGFFDRFSHIATWSGRYPASIFPKDLPTPCPLPLGDKYIVRRWRGDNDNPNIDTVVKALLNELE